MHRNSQKRVYGDHIYFITCNVEGVYPFFEHEILCDLWIHELRFTKKISQMELFAFCLNYDHFHLLIKPHNVTANYSKIMQFLKRNSSQNINKILGYTYFRTNPSTTTHEGDNAHYRLRNELNTFDEYVLKLRESFKREYGENHDIPKFKWQKSFFDHVVRNKQDFEKHYQYTMYNYKKHELPEEWKYMGLRFREVIDDFIE